MRTVPITWTMALSLTAMGTALGDRRGRRWTSGFAHVDFEGLTKQQEETSRGWWTVLDLGRGRRDSAHGWEEGCELTALVADGGKLLVTDGRKERGLRREPPSPRLQASFPVVSQTGALGFSTRFLSLGKRWSWRISSA